MTKKFACIVALGFAALSSPAMAQFAKPEDAVKYRQSALTLMNTHLLRIAAMANGRVPYDAKVASENAELLATLSRLPWAGFGPDTDMISSKAKPEIWSQKARFNDLAEKMTAETIKLAAAAKTNNLDNLKSSFGATAASCKNCHDAFRGR